jgi:hypothetical protein
VARVEQVVGECGTHGFHGFNGPTPYCLRTRRGDVP